MGALGRTDGPRQDVQRFAVPEAMTEDLIAEVITRFRADGSTGRAGRI